MTDSRTKLVVLFLKSPSQVANLLYYHYQQMGKDETYDDTVLLEGYISKFTETAGQCGVTDADQPTLIFSKRNNRRTTYVGLNLDEVKKIILDYRNAVYFQQPVLAWRRERAEGWCPTFFFSVFKSFQTITGSVPDLITVPLYKHKNNVRLFV